MKISQTWQCTYQYKEEYNYQSGNTNGQNPETIHPPPCLVLLGK